MLDNLRKILHNYYRKEINMTLKQVAEEVGVSISTVSRVINQKNPHAASPEIQKKIWDAVQKLNYSTPTLRNKLIASSTPVIACLFARDTKTVTDNPFFTGIAQNFEKLALSMNFSTKHYFTTFDIYESNFEKIMSDDISGILIIGRHRQDLVQKLYPRVKNIVYAGLMPPVSDVYDTVTCDAYKIGIAAAEYFVSKNHKDIGFIGETENEIRYSGFYDGLRNAGIPITSDWVINIQASMENGYVGMKKLLAQKKRPSAVFCMNDYLAVGAIRAMHDESISIPEEMSIMGVDDIEATAFTTPKLTTIHTPMRELGEIAAKVLIDKITGGHSININVSLPFYIVERESCTKKAD